MCKNVLVVLAAVAILAAGASACNSLPPAAATSGAGASEASTTLPAPGNGPALQQDTPTGGGTATSQPGSSRGKSSAGTQASGQGSKGSPGSSSAKPGTVSATPAPQNGLTEWSTIHGVVADYAPPSFTLKTDDGDSIPALLGNLTYLSGLGLTLQNGDAVTVTGFYDPNGSLAVGKITPDATGQTYVLRDETGRPVWAGGPKR